MSSLPRETGRAPAAYMNRASPSSWGFIGFLCKPRYISLFLSSIFLSATFFLYLSLSKPFSSPMSSHFGYPGSNGGKTPAFDHVQFALTHGPDISGSYAILLFIALSLPSITSPIHNWVLFLLWLHPFILSGVISPLISNSILGT